MRRGIFVLRKASRAPAAMDAVPPVQEADLGVPVFRRAARALPATIKAPEPTAAPANPIADPRPLGLRTLVIGHGITLRGSITHAERLVVEGTVDCPRIRTIELCVGETGLCRGEVEVERAEVAGTVKGSIATRGCLTLRSGGLIEGLIRCRWLSVEEGGRIAGWIDTTIEAGAATALSRVRPAPPVLAAVP